MQIQIQNVNLRKNNKASKCVSLEVNVMSLFSPKACADLTLADF